MKKSLLVSALLFSTLSLSACSNSVSPVAQEQAIVNNFTENTEINNAEIKEIESLLAKSSIEENSFSVKTVEQGKDVDVDMLLMNPKAARRANFWGLKTADKLLNAGSSRTKRWFLERKLGGLFPSQAFKNQVMFWLVRADLVRVRDVDINDSFLLAMAGVSSTPHLARFNNIIDQSALKVQLSILGFQYGMPIPSMDEIKSWTQDAVNHPPVLW